ncbi:MAG: hypothetical protein A3G18_02075 [Rhodospirillales bacterium RIFCSPLOWO2_12_FULL_58_28]|nr:MAG: hypothetical protein A3H92_07440 [Rhodospirillales bacterium RIFCSPLOWO2_02_FULL_58_16]OHC79075.1 MAG: hypothetical protein A3G18_02075 [Rhodospirillales bacterium RIFCSPLOWO2_12_FULL_58_28]
MIDRWDRRFLDLAEHISTWSKDPSTKVGAVLTHTEKRRVISVGFNGFPAGIEDSEERLGDRAVKYEMVVHAEQNAILFAGRQADGCTLYVTPLAPCARCAVIIIQAGIVRVVAPKPDFEQIKWGEQARISDTMFREAGLTVDYDEA